MLEARREIFKINPALWTLKFSRARKRKNKTAMAETVTFVGFLYETPKQRHPQDLAKGWLVRVSESKNITNGVYSIEVWEESDPTSVFASAARLVTNLPERESYSEFGLNEVNLSTDTFNLMHPESLSKKVKRCFRASVRGFKYDFK